MSYGNRALAEFFAQTAGHAGKRVRGIFVEARFRGIARAHVRVIF